MFGVSHRVSMDDRPSSMTSASSDYNHNLFFSFFLFFLILFFVYFHIQFEWNVSTVRRRSVARLGTCFLFVRRSSVATLIVRWRIPRVSQHGVRNTLPYMDAAPTVDFKKAVFFLVSTEVKRRTRLLTYRCREPKFWIIRRKMSWVRAICLEIELDTSIPTACP